MPRWKWVIVQVRAGRRVPGVDPLVFTVNKEAWHFAQVAAGSDRIHERRHDLFPVADGDRVNRRMIKPTRISRRVVSAYDDKHARHFLFDPSGQPNRAILFRGEIALQAHPVGPKRLADRDSPNGRLNECDFHGPLSKPRGPAKASPFLEI